MAEKIEKSRAGYIHFAKTNYQCQECYKFEPNKGHQDCVEVSGVIKAIGSCNTFVKGRSSQTILVNIPRKLSHAEAGYAENKVGFSCKRCEYFMREAWDCKKVDKDSEGIDKGIIHPDACCNNWAQDKVFGVIA